MNRLLPFVTFLLLTASSVEAQRLKLFRSIIYTAQGERIDGILYDMTDSTVQLVPNQAAVVRQLRNGQVPTVFDCPWQDMNRIVIRRRGHLGQSLFVGGGIGLAVGAVLIGSINPGTGLSERLSLAAFGLTAPIAGLTYGVVAGTSPYHVYHINRDWIVYRNAKANLRLLSVMAQRQVIAADLTKVAYPQLPAINP